MKLPIISVLALLTMPLPMNAESIAPIKKAVSAGKIELAPFKVEGFTIGKKLVFDDAYAKKHGRSAMKAPFEVILPKRDHVFVVYPPQSGQAHIKLNFGTADKQLIENLQFVDMKIPLGDTEKRLEATAQLLMRQGLGMAFKGYQEPKHLETYRHKVGKYEAVTVHGQMLDPAKGVFFVKLIGILNPNSADSVMGFSMIDGKRAEIKTPNDLRTEGVSNKIMHSVKFITK